MYGVMGKKGCNSLWNLFLLKFHVFISQPTTKIIPLKPQSYKFPDFMNSDAFHQSQCMLINIYEIYVKFVFELYFLSTTVET